MMSFWSTRSKADAAAYWETRGAGYRGLLASMLRKFAPFHSVLEIGCHSGPNLWAIRQQFPVAHLIGLDPSESCAKFGQVAAVREAMERMTPAQRDAFDGQSEARGEVLSVGVDFMVGSAPQGLAAFRDIDVVVSCYTLAYLSPTELHDTLAHISTSTQRGILLVEPMPTDVEPEGPIVSARIPCRRHNYAEWFAQHAPEWRAERLAFPGPQGLNGALRASRV